MIPDEREPGEYPATAVLLGPQFAAHWKEFVGETLRLARLVEQRKAEAIERKEADQKQSTADQEVGGLTMETARILRRDTSLYPTGSPHNKHGGRPKHELNSHN